MGATGSIVFLICFLSASIAEATCHLYIVPATGSGDSAADQSRPKYISVKGVGRYDVIRFGNQGYFIVSADVSDALDKAAQGQADVIRIPDNLNATIGTNLAKVQSQLEAINIPADWITASMTYRTVVRTITQMFLFMNRFAGINGVTVPLLTDLLPLDTPFSSLSKLNQDRLYKTGASFSLDTSTWSTSTLRQILKNIADQFAKVPVPIGCATI